MRRPSSNGRARVRVWARAGTSRGAREYSYSCAYSHCPPHAYGVDAAFGVRFSSPVRPRASRSRFSLSRAACGRVPRAAPRRPRRGPPLLPPPPPPRRCFATPPPRHLSNGRPAPRPRRPRPPMRPRPACPRRGVPPRPRAPNASALADLEASRARVAPLRGSASASGSARNARIHRPVLSSRSPWYQPSNGALHSGQFLARRVAQASMHGAQNACEHPGSATMRLRSCSPPQTWHRVAPFPARRPEGPRAAEKGAKVGDGNGRPRPDAPWPGASSRGSSPSRGVERSHHAPGVVPTLGRRCRGRFGARDATASSTAAAEGGAEGARPIRGSRATPTRGSSPRASSRGVPAGEVTERARDDSHGLKSHATKCMAPAPRGVIIVVFLLASSTRQQPKPRRRRRASSRRPRLPPRVVPRLAAMRASPARACFSCPPRGRRLAPRGRPRAAPRASSARTRPGSRPGRETPAPRARATTTTPPPSPRRRPTRVRPPPAPPVPIRRHRPRRNPPPPPSSPPSSARGMTTRSPLRRAAPNHIGAAVRRKHIHKRLPTAAAIPRRPLLFSIATAFFHPCEKRHSRTAPPNHPDPRVTRAHIPPSSHPLLSDPSSVAQS